MWRICAYVCVIVGFIQERRSEKSLEALNKLVPHHCHIIRYVPSYPFSLSPPSLPRPLLPSLPALPGPDSPHHNSDSTSHHLLANEVVPGDIVTFTTGDRIPADVRLVSAYELEIDESSLTGETEARRKGVEACRGRGGGESVANGSSGGGGVGVYGNGVGGNGNPYGNGHGHNGSAHGQEGVALADRHCIAYMGTLVRNGELAPLLLVSCRCCGEKD